MKEYKPYDESLRQRVKQVGGYIAKEEEIQSDYKIENSVIIKVPVENFDEALLLLSKDVVKTNEKNISSQDVTAEMFDTRSRLEAKRQVRLRYLELLKQAKNMEEILIVQKEINDIQEDIESASGRISYLTNSAAYSTLSLTYYQILDQSAKNSGDPGFFSKIKESFKGGWNFLGDVFVGIVSIWPLILLGLIVWLMIRKYRKPVAAK